MMGSFVIPTLVGEYSGVVKDSWGNRATTGVYLLSHWSKVSLRVVARPRMNSYANCDDNEDIVSCEWKKEIFVNSSNSNII